MKKFLLTAALGCAILTPAFAQAPENELNGGLPFIVEDYFVLDPNGTFPPDDPINVTFTNPQEMIDGMEAPPNTFRVTASRSWTVNYKATDFDRVEPDQPGIAPTLPVSILSITTSTTDPFVHDLVTDMVVDHLEQPIAKGWGGIDRPYTITGKITIGNLIESQNISGTYVSSVTHILTLD